MEVSPFNAHFGHRSRRRRQIIGKTGADIAREIAMNQPQYNRLEQGKLHTMRPEHLARLARALMPTPEY